jgi:hypothetical protein
MIYIDEETGIRVYIQRPYKGRSRLDTPEIRDDVGVIEIEDDPKPADFTEDTYYAEEDWQAVERPYVIYNRRPAEQIAATRWAKIKQLRDTLTDTGGCLVSGKWFHSDPKSKVQQIALAMAGAAAPAIPWKTMDGSFVTLTPTLVSQIFQAQMVREQTIFAHAESLRADPNADINAGWPEHCHEVL